MLNMIKIIWDCITCKDLKAKIAKRNRADREPMDIRNSLLNRQAIKFPHYIIDDDLKHLLWIDAQRNWIEHLHLGLFDGTMLLKVMVAFDIPEDTKMFNTYLECDRYRNRPILSIALSDQAELIADINDSFDELEQILEKRNTVVFDTSGINWPVSNDPLEQIQYDKIRENFLGEINANRPSFCPSILLKYYELEHWYLDTAMGLKPYQLLKAYNTVPLTDLPVDHHSDFIDAINEFIKRFNKRG